MTDPTASAPQPPARTLAQKLERLFDVVRPAEEPSRRYQGREVVAGVRAAGGELSASHLSELRRGIKVNPTLRVLADLAAFFHVRAGYFIDPRVADEVEAELELRAAMRDAKVRDLAYRAASLDPAQRSALYRLLAEIIRENDDT